MLIQYFKQSQYVRKGRLMELQWCSNILDDLSVVNFHRLLNQECWAAFFIMDKNQSQTQKMILWYFGQLNFVNVGFSRKWMCDQIHLTSICTKFYYWLLILYRGQFCLTSSFLFTCFIKSFTPNIIYTIQGRVFKECADWIVYQMLVNNYEFVSTP